MSGIETTLRGKVLGRQLRVGSWGERERDDSEKEDLGEETILKVEV